MEKATRFSASLLAWFAEQGRDLPWRGSRDPYAIWVSEVMLQQTRVSQVIPYYERWMAALPSISALAESSLDQVLVLWEGLGYYQRAQNLHEAANILVAEYGGKLPETPGDLEQLPGIGRYTASAIASIAFGVDVLALDGNLRRVLSRLVDLRQDPRAAKAEQILREKGNQLLPKGKSAAFNQALMDLGAEICKPQNPVCEACPVSIHCLAFERGVQRERPIKVPRPSIPHYTIAAGIARRDGKVLIAQRPMDKLLGGLWEFPGGKCESGETLEDCLRREWQEELRVEIDPGQPVLVVNHAYTHFQITVHSFECVVRAGEPSPVEHVMVQWVDPGALTNYPMGKVDRLISQKLLTMQGSEGD